MNKDLIKKTFNYIWGGLGILFSIFMCLWVSWWWLIFLLFVVDVYFIKYINWHWYRNSKNKIVKIVMGWVTDIVFAVIAISIFSLFFFQNFTIPSSSLEKTMLIGDYLFVNKLSYGPRMPMTPISLPLAHNEMPIFGGKCFLDNPQWKYRRLKGLGSVERNDLVVFNFPAGDTVATKMPNPDYYNLCKVYGREHVNNNPQIFGKIIYRPVDKRDFYVKRCVALPGDIFEIKDNQIYINGKKAINPKHLQFNYIIKTNGTPITTTLLDDLDISYDDMQQLAVGENNELYYHCPLTSYTLEELKKEPYILSIEIEQSTDTNVYPIDMNLGYTRDNYGPIEIPKKGKEIELTEKNIALYKRCITAYEGHKMTIDNGKVYIDGKLTNKYKFGQDYYWMMGDNRHNSADSRYWGFVPEDHIVGKPAFIWFSKNKDKGLLDGGIRWKRMMRMIDPS